MSCGACRTACNEGQVVYPYRWRNAVIELRGCAEHIRQVFAALNDAQNAPAAMLREALGYAEQAPASDMLAQRDAALAQVAMLREALEAYETAFDAYGAGSGPEIECIQRDLEARWDTLRIRALAASAPDAKP